VRVRPVILALALSAPALPVRAEVTVRFAGELVPLADAGRGGHASTLSA
jgi:hypothetical protein